MGLLQNAAFLNGNANMERYLNDVRSIPMISIDEEINLAKKIRQNDQMALAKLIKSNLRFVITIAKAYQNQGLPLTDLINEGNYGLIQAARRFDESKGTKFISYAVWWIKQSIIHALETHSRMIRLPQNKTGNLKKINRARQLLEQELEREPTLLELAEYMKVCVSNIKKIISSSVNTISLETPIGENKKQQLKDIIEPPNSSDTDSDLLKEIFRTEMGKIIDKLNSQEADIIRLYFGINTEKAHTLDEISKKYQLTRERIRQIKKRALSKLRYKANCKNLQSFLE
jgi:RNA polymerase primary sigma factor